MSNKTKQKHIIFSNEWHSEDEQEWKDAYKEHLELNEMTEDDLDYGTWFADELDMELSDEKANLDVDLDGRVIAIADLGLWNGRHQGYSLLDCNANSIFNLSEGTIEYYCDRYNVRATQAHHDGTNYILYRVLREGVNVDRFTQMIYDGVELDSKTINRYTKSLRPVIAKIYGW